MKKLNIAVDGPSGAGKSSLARALAHEMGLIYVDTGALYRTIGLFMTENNIDVHDGPAVAARLGDIHLELTYQNGTQTVLLNGTDVGEKIRTPQISMAASAVSAIPAVREFLLGIQRDMVQKGGVVMDGRDIGTVIMPDADAKLFLVASPAARAKRRYLELCAKGIDCSFEQILEETNQRDQADRERNVAPAIPAEDAMFIDNSDLGPAETVAEAMNLIAQKCAEKRS
ncbi:MAG: (d)CMP kinase [Clostridia bacterium]|jgi:cytidylate kinase|nr:(d)CMP kinase [Clostridia bacterium]